MQQNEQSVSHSRNRLKNQQNSNSMKRSTGVEQLVDGSELVDEAPETPVVEPLQYKYLVISMNYETQFGEELFITGSTFDLGNWNPDTGIKLEWSEGHKWFARLQFKAFGDKVFEFKFVIKNQGSGYVKWEGGQNH